MPENRPSIDYELTAQIGIRNFMTGLVAAVVVAGGRGERAGGGVPKQYRAIAGEPMIRLALRAFVEHAAIDLVQPVLAVVDRPAVVRGQQEEAQRLRLVPLE